MGVAGTAMVGTGLLLWSNKRICNVWLWALAHDVFADDRFKTLALAAALPRAKFERVMALLRLHQLTGDTHWVTAAHSLAAQGPDAQLVPLDLSLLVAEMQAPERAVLPPYISPF